MSEHSWFQNRELSWLNFNARVLEEAEDKENPFLERLRFLSIFGSNLDEFFMIRVAGLRDQIAAGYSALDVSGRSPAMQIEAISVRAHELVERYYRCFHSFSNELGSRGISFAALLELGDLENKIKEFFISQIFPVLTPMGVDPTHPFPFLASGSLNILVQLASRQEHIYGIIPVPAILPRYYILEKEGHKYILFIEDIIRHFSASLFPGFEVTHSVFFRITRNADLTVDEEGAEDLLQTIQDQLKERKKGRIVRLEIEKPDATCREKLKEFFSIDDRDLYVSDGPLDLTFLTELAGLLTQSFPKDNFPPFTPRYTPVEDMFALLKERDLLLHHPYDSFEPVIDLLSQAAIDPRVLAVKMTLYRSSGKESEVIRQLMKAIANDKQVTVMVELKARFDEEKNIAWAKRLEEAGAHVVYGMKGLKTHSKALLIIRKEESGEIKRYMHFGTGNYNEKTARLYTDISYLTSREDYAYDAASFFNFLTGYSIEPEWKKVSIAPVGIRQMILNLIDNEIATQVSGSPGHVIAKMNALVDRVIIEKLYEASSKGVKIDLIVRGTCCLVTGIKGVTDNIHVRNVVGRFLEHSRIIYFKNAGNELFFISSADWMPRNLDRRVELLVPIEDPESREKLRQILKLNLQDNVKASSLKGLDYERVKAGRQSPMVHMQASLSGFLPL